MKRIALLSILLCAAATVVAMPLLAAQQVTVRGEVVGSVCWVKNGATGADHRECAQMCADNGIPLALLEEGSDELIWLASKDPMQSPNEQLKAHASHTVEITGEWIERGGTKMLVIDSIKHISAN
jgi:hypothetical protein